MQRETALRSPMTADHGGRMVQFLDTDGSPRLPAPLRVVLILFIIAVVVFAITLAVD